MKKLFIALIVLLSASGVFAEEPKGQIMPFNDKANEEIIVTNMTFKKDAFKIYVHTKGGSAFHLNAFSANYTSTEEGWLYLTKTTELRNKETWKSSSDFEVLEFSDYICIESKSGTKYNYSFQTKHDKLYITVSVFREGDDW
jgi:hypothetical protein